MFNFYVQQVHSTHISTPVTLLCFKTDSMNGFIVDCSKYLFWFHIINQSGNAVLVSLSEEVTSTSHFWPVDNPHWPLSALYSSHWLVSFKILLVEHFMLFCRREIGGTLFIQPRQHWSWSDWLSSKTLSLCLLRHIMLAFKLWKKIIKSRHFFSLSLNKLCD